jgi:hypothetical protein
VLCIPLFHDLADDQIDRIVATIRLGLEISSTRASPRPGTRLRLDGPTNHAPLGGHSPQTVDAVR